MIVVNFAQTFQIYFSDDSEGYSVENKLCMGEGTMFL